MYGQEEDNWRVDPHDTTDDTKTIIDVADVLP